MLSTKEIIITVISIEQVLLIPGNHESHFIKIYFHDDEAVFLFIPMSLHL